MGSFRLFTRSARHLASDVDLKHALEVGKKAVMFVDKGLFGVMPTIKRISNNPYQWKIEATPIERIANVEKKLPKSFISSDGFGITKRVQTTLDLSWAKEMPVILKTILCLRKEN